MEMNTKAEGHENQKEKVASVLSTPSPSVHDLVVFVLFMSEKVTIKSVKSKQGGLQERRSSWPEPSPCVLICILRSHLLCLC
jgi:hypothetical protein